jgi:serine/threonine protein kinase
LKHKNIVKSLGGFYDSVNNKYYLKMELVDGGTVADLIKKKNLDLPQIKSLIFDISDALVYLHGHKVYHRDLKPENILLLAKNGKLQAKIADFNLSVQITSSAASKKSSKGGTSVYFSPERGHGDRYDEKADMWAFGCIIIEMLLLLRLTDSIWSDRPEVSQKRENLIQEVGNQCPSLGKQVRKLLCLEAKDRISANQLKSAISEVMLLQ